jgi:DNA helicase-2/ATP-dependent DNA helicase PcrA
MIDEAQDYSPFQLHMIRSIYPRGGMTLLGDFQQAVLAHTFASGNSLRTLQEQFPAESTLLFELTKSYRSTREIVDLSTSIVKRTDIEPFSRNGEKPIVVRVDSGRQLPEVAARAIRDLQAKGAASIAVICKTAHQSEQAHRDLSAVYKRDELRLQDGEYHMVDLELEPGMELKVKMEKHRGIEETYSQAASVPSAGASVLLEDTQQEPQQEQSLELVTKYTQTFRRGVVVIPSYLAKGLEFDGVVVYDASEEAYSLERDRRLFYTVCTRALHHLVLLTPGDLTSFLTDASVYDVKYEL